ncbi:MAG: metal-binding protein [Clostridia bacterium]|nr:metal-binding protein [Clostridia bacterium]
MNYKYFENKDCEFYPCHKMEEQNCLFCFCPLYFLDCGGKFKMIEGKAGHMIKDCSDCTIPHLPNGYDYVMKKLEEKGV